MAGKGTRHRFELSRLEIAGVLVSAVAGLFVVFLLGIYAGRGLAERHLDMGQQIVRLPVAPAAEQTPGAEDGLTFYDTLGRDERVAKADARGAGEHPVVPPPGEAVARAQAGRRGADREARRAENQQPRSGPQGRAARRGQARADAGAADAGAAKAERAPRRRRRRGWPWRSRPAVVPTPRSATKGDWSVQVSATRDPRTADGVLRRLKAKGYDAFVLKVRRRGETFYRVRVGHYVSLEEAQQVVSRLRREPGVPEAFVASD